MISARDVFCLYPTPRGQVAALRGLTLEVAAGERVVVHGPNGSGKSTLLRVLAGDRAPDAGTVRVCGVDLAGAGERDRVELRARRLGLVDQHHARTLRPELTIVDNVALQLRLTGARRAKARAHAGDLLGRLGLGHLAGRRPGGLSGGEAQRVAVCAAVAHGPALILADEPTGELNREAAGLVYDLLAGVAADTGAALLLVSHDAGAARVADRVVRIRDGRLSEVWHPARPGDESLVVDDRGWVRLPERVRSRVGPAVRVSLVDGGVVLRRTGPEQPGTAAPAEVTAPAPAEVAAPAPAEVAVPAPDRTGTRPAAELTDVGVARGGHPILTGQSVRLWPGRLAVVRGPSGSGKTTLLRVLAGLERPDDGRARVGDVDLDGLDREGLAALRRRRLAVAAQGSALIETLDVRENLAMVRETRGLPPAAGLVDGWLAALDLTALRHRPVVALSGGERQRVSVARVLAAEPDIAVLDEPTSQQDEAHAELLARVLLDAARRGTAVLAATHDPALTAAADDVIDLA